MPEASRQTSTVLVVEDNPADLLFIDEALSASGDRRFETRRAERLADAVAAIRKDGIDVVLLDLGLPDSHGIATLETLVGQFPRMPIIILTGLSDERLAYEAVKRGAQDYMVKGKFDDQSLPRAIHYAIERKRVELELRESDERFTTAFRLSPMGLSLTRLRDGKLLDVNEAWCKLTGFSREAALSSQSQELMNLNKEVRAHILAQVKEKGAATNVEAEIDTHILGRRVVLISVEHLNLAGEACVLSTFVDITERKQAELALHESEERYRHMVETSEEGIVVTDNEGKILFANPKFAHLLQFELHEVMNRSIFDFFHEDTMTLAMQIREQQLIGKAQQLDFKYKRKDGSTMWTIASVSPILGPGGEYTGSLGMITDITTRKLAEDNLKASEAHNRTLYESAERRLAQTMALRKIDTAISNSLDLHFTLDVVVSMAIQHLGVDAADVLLYNQDSKALTFFIGQGFRTGAAQKAYVPLGKGHAGRAVLERKRISIPNLHENLSEFQDAIDFADEGFIDFHTVPLVAKGRVLGVLETFRRTPFLADAEWFNFLETLAGQAAIAIENISLFEDLQRANDSLIVGYEAAIEGWSRALDLRDKETEGHSLRVTDLTLRLARSMGIKDVELAHVRHGALLHDIGKMGIPDSILLKPGKLTDEEWVVMKQHPELARRMLAPIAYLKDAMDIPYAHHEKWDGSGYPLGLSGANIPLVARIFAVADVYDALTSDRPYRERWGKQKTLDYIKGESGKHFDPDVVKAFVDLELS